MFVPVAHCSLQLAAITQVVIHHNRIPRDGKAGAMQGSNRRKLRLGPLPEYVGYALRRAQMSTVTQFVGALRDVDLRPTQFAVLTVIRENPGVRQSEVC